MLDEAAKGDFIRQGLIRYPDARATVDYFESEVVRTMLDALEATRLMASFTPNKQPPANALQTSKAIGTAVRNIQTSVTGTFKADGRVTTIMLELYWNPPCRPRAPVVLTCGAWGERWRQIALPDLPGRDRRVSLVPVTRKTENRLVVDLGDDSDLSDGCALLLAAVDEALAAVGPATP